MNQADRRETGGHDEERGRHRDGHDTRYVDSLVVPKEKTTLLDRRRRRHTLDVERERRRLVEERVVRPIPGDRPIGVGVGVAAGGGTEDEVVGLPAAVQAADGQRQATDVSGQSVVVTEELPIRESRI